MPSDSKGVACWYFQKAEVPRRVPKEWHWYLNTAEETRFLLVFCHFLGENEVIFKILINLKKNGHTICDPYQICFKIFSLRHHGVKSFWTKVGLSIPMPLLLGLTKVSSYFVESYYSVLLLFKIQLFKLIMLYCWEHPWGSIRLRQIQLVNLHFVTYILLKIFAEKKDS